MLVLATILLMLAIIIMIIGTLSGKDVSGKVISVNCTTSYIIALVSLWSLDDKNNIYFLDVALVYGGLGFIASIAFLKYMFYRR
jgi:multisubunit Na+/H+ antiporter MnhF subunit